MIRSLFIKTINFLNNNQIFYWVDFGTLLGIHRNNDIILGDNDADICIPSTEEHKLQTALNNSGNYFESWSREDWPAFRTKKKYFHVDLYLVDIDLDPKLVYIPDSKSTPLEYLTHFEIVTMRCGKNNITFRQPTEWEQLLEFRYGKSWKNHDLSHDFP